MDLSQKNKRYTFFTDDYPVVTCDHCYEDQNENYCGPAIERLAEYEATGLMPAEVAALQYQLRHAQSGQRWIPIAERLPTSEDASNGEVYAIFAPTRRSSNWPYKTVQNNPDEFTHWRPLPELPKEVE